MCIKIICSDHEHEFDMAMPLEQQIVGAKEVVVSYDPEDPKIPSFVGQIETMVKNGNSCGAEIKVDAKDTFSGMKLKRYLGTLKIALDTNEFIKKLSTFHYDADHKLGELSKMCLGETDER
jgi:hypothetical protein